MDLMAPFHEGPRLWSGGQNCLPSETKLLLTKNHSEISVVIITNSTHDSLIKVCVSQRFGECETHPRLRKKNSQKDIFAIILCQRVC